VLKLAQSIKGASAIAGQCGNLADQAEALTAAKSYSALQLSNRGRKSVFLLVREAEAYVRRVVAGVDLGNLASLDDSFILSPRPVELPRQVGDRG